MHSDKVMLAAGSNNNTNFPRIYYIHFDDTKDDKSVSTNIEKKSRLFTRIGLLQTKHRLSKIKKILMKEGDNVQ